METIYNTLLIIGLEKSHRHRHRLTTHTKTYKIYCFQYHHFGKQCKLFITFVKYDNVKFILRNDTETWGN